MRIRFVTKAQLQVLQASKAEKHLMPDGPIPLFGSLPSAVSRQWGTVAAGDYALPISFTSNYSVVANDAGTAIASIKIQKKTNSIVNFYGRDYSGAEYNRPSVIFIAVGV